MQIQYKDPDQAPFGTVAAGGPRSRKFTRYAGAGADLSQTNQKMKKADDDVCLEDFDDNESPGMMQAAASQSTTP